MTGDEVTRRAQIAERYWKSRGVPRPMRAAMAEELRHDLAEAATSGTSSSLATDTDIRTMAEAWATAGKVTFRRPWITLAIFAWTTLDELAGLIRQLTENTPGQSSAFIALTEAIFVLPLICLNVGCLIGLYRGRRWGFALTACVLVLSLAFEVAVSVTATHARGGSGLWLSMALNLIALVALVAATQWLNRRPASTPTYLEA